MLHVLDALDDADSMAMTPTRRDEKQDIMPRSGTDLY